MPAKWNVPASPLSLEAPRIILAAPGSVPASPRARLTYVLAAGSLLAVAVQPYRGPWPLTVPAAPSNGFVVINNNDTGAGSLGQAITDANAHPGPDVITFAPQVSGTITLTADPVKITDTVSIQGPGPGLLAISGGNAHRVFYLYNPTHTPFTATISGLTIRDGQGITASGGGGIVAWDMQLTLDNVDVISNSAGIHDGGGIAIQAGSGLAGSLELKNSIVSDNQAGGDGGGIFSRGALTVDNTSVVSNSAPSGGGGAIALFAGGGYTGKLLLSNSVISGNVSNNGGGVYLYATSALNTIQTTQILSNTAHNRGGGVYLYNLHNPVMIQDSTLAGNHANGSGGGLALYSGQSILTIQRSTVWDNTSGNNGGGLFLNQSNAAVVLEDVTVSNNQTTQRGGGIYLYNAPHLGIRNSTIVSNTAATGGGISALYNTTAITDTIIAGNLAPDGPDISGTFQLKYDLVQITGTATISDAGGNLFGLDPQLGPLANNGGPTLTRRPLPGSPVVNAGDPAFAPPPSTDQRGQPRVAGGRVDIGAVEVGTGTLQFSAAAFLVAENGITATITVSRTGGSEGAAAVDYATGGGTALAGSDYLSATGTLHWTPGDGTAKTFQISIVNDNQIEADETVGLALSNAQGAALGTPSTALLTIIDDDNLFLPLLRR